MTAAADSTGLRRALLGRTFVHPVFDYVLIGGGLSLVFTVFVVAAPAHFQRFAVEDLAWILLLANGAHFASSTVRLYTKPGTWQTWPFLTMVLPVLALALLGLVAALPTVLGTHLVKLYLTWSPYHYAAQAYGLATVYSFRSGCTLSAREKSLLWWTSMLPFFTVFLSGDGFGLSWLVPEAWLGRFPLVTHALRMATDVLRVASFVAPAALLALVWRSRGRPMPLISILTVVANGVWWLMLSPMKAFVYATIFHGIQYLAIVIIFHVKDQLALPGNRHGWRWHAAAFYGMSFLLAYGLFLLLPSGMQFVGFGPVESVLLVAAAINVHHFVVDAYIWRLKPTDGNRRIVESAAAVPAPA